MESAKNGRWIILFYKFGMIRVKSLYKLLKTISTDLIACIIKNYNTVDCPLIFQVHANCHEQMRKRGIKNFDFI